MSGLHARTTQIGAATNRSSPPVLSNEVSGSPSASNESSDATRSVAPVDPSFFFDPRQQRSYNDQSTRLSHVSYAHMPVVHSNRLMASHHPPTFDELAQARRKP
uniref:Uncharacterized protein n=1 Tax=Plectus sambesii TaxID=2011161 RepID=A0A914VFF6_9BILA